MRELSDHSISSWTRWIVAIYAAVGFAVATGVWFVGGRLVWVHPLVARGASVESALQSAAGGLFIAIAVVVATRWTTHRFEWAKSLRDGLSLPLRGLGVGPVLLLALSSGVGEEVVFRGALQPSLGLPLTSLLFGFVHQMPGKARWYWVAWTTVVGVMIGGLFEWTGHLLGPVLAHVVINAVNLNWLARQA